MEIRVLADGDAVAREGAAIIAAQARAAVAARGRFIWAVSGGHTPWLMLRNLAGEEVPWSGVHVAHVDERVAPGGASGPEPHSSAGEPARARSAASRAGPCDAGGSDRSGGGSAPIRPDASRDRRLAADIGSRPSGPWTGRPYCLPGTWRSGARRHRRRRCADRGLSGEAADDFDVSGDQSLPTHPLAGYGKRQGRDAHAPARR